MTEPYFERLSDTWFRATEHTSGAWDEEQQHIAPALGLLVHCAERDHRSRHTSPLLLGRASFDIFGVVPVADVEVRTSVRRAGRTIELVEAALRHDDRTVAEVRAWFLSGQDTTAVAGDGFEPMPAPADVPEFPLESVWPGGFIASTEALSTDRAPGRARTWVRTAHPLLSGEEVSRTAAVCGLVDVANGIAVRAEPAEVLFPNVDLTAHFVREPERGWLGFDTRVTFGPSGLGETHSILHDEFGPLGSVAQCLTVRPR